MSGITIFVPFINAFGGVERLVASLAAHVDALGLGCTVVCFEDTIGFASYVDAPVVVQVLEAKRSVAAELLALRRFALSSRGEMPWLVFDLKGAFYASVLPQSFVLHLTDPPSLLGKDVSKHAFSMPRSPGLEPERVGWRLRIRGELAHRLTRRGVRRADAVAVMTDAIAREVGVRYGVTPVVIRPGVSRPRVIGGRRGSASELRVLSVSRLEPSKRVDCILDAFALLRQADEPERNWRLDIVGSGSEAVMLQERARALGIESSTYFHGAVSQATLDDLFSQAGLFVMPAVQGYGLPALEALSRRVPVVLHADSGVSEILAGTPWVRLVKSHSAPDLASAIESLAGGDVEAMGDLPPFPTDIEWASQIAALCHWRRN